MKYFFLISGMTESIIAAAASRIGKRVLHLDRYICTNIFIKHLKMYWYILILNLCIGYYRNDYYGGMWASFTFEALQKWLDECRKGKTNDTVKNSSPLIQDSEKSVTIGNQFSTVFNIEEKWFIPEYGYY